MDNEPAKSQKTSSTSVSGNPPVKTMDPKVAALVILIVGLIALIGGYFIVKNSAIPKSYITTSGQVKSEFPAMSNTYDIQIEFTVNNKQYSFTSRVPAQSARHDSVYFVGNNTVRVAYNPSNPGVGEKNASDKATPAYGVVFIILGGIFAVIGLVSTLQQLLKRG